MPDATPLPVAVVGVGRMGHHHARIYDALAEAELVAVVDADHERAATTADTYGCCAHADTAELLAHHPTLRAASIAVPTAHHRTAAAPLLAHRVACLVEKPLAPTLREAQFLATTAAEHGAMLQVGHTERFNPAVRAIAAMDITPRFVEVERISPMTFRSLDVGVVMDMMIHDLDIVMMLVGAPLKRVDATGVAVLGSHEDVANARLVFENGCVANLTSSRLALKTHRKLRLFCEDAYVSLDYQKHNGLVIRRSGNTDALHSIRDQIARGADLSELDYHDLVQVEELTMARPEDDRDPLTAQLASFIDAVRQGRPPEVDAQAGYAAVEASERVIQAIGEHRWEGLSTAPL